MAQSQELFQVPELQHFIEGSDPDDNPVIPSQLPTTGYQTTELSISCGKPDTPSFHIKLTVDAGPGCGGIAWPAGSVSKFLLSHRKHPFWCPFKP